MAGPAAPASVSAWPDARRSDQSAAPAARLSGAPAMIGKMVRPVAGPFAPGVLFRMSQNPPSDASDRARDARPRRGPARGGLVRCALACWRCCASLAGAEVQPPSTAPGCRACGCRATSCRCATSRGSRSIPRSTGSTASIDIVVRVERATDVVWLNAKNITLRDAKAVIGGAQPEEVPGATDHRQRRRDGHQVRQAAAGRRGAARAGLHGGHRFRRRDRRVPAARRRPLVRRHAVRARGCPARVPVLRRARHEGRRGGSRWSCRAACARSPTCRSSARPTPART